jgi:DNA-binding NarL/FixJ family response regulator
MRPPVVWASMSTVRDISVLVVDDHALFADALRARLAREHDLGPISVAYRRRDALEQVAAACPAVVILDVVLDEGTGLDLLDEIRAISPDSKVVMLTAVGSVDEVVTALFRGARAWLPKTTDIGHLVKVIRGVRRGEAWLAPDLLGQLLTDLTTRAVMQPNPLGSLTAREREVLQGMVDGLNRTEIAERLRVSGNTVRTHTQNLMAKLGVHSTLESVALALRSGLRASGS